MVDILWEWGYYSCDYYYSYNYYFNRHLRYHHLLLDPRWMPVSSEFYSPKRIKARRLHSTPLHSICRPINNGINETWVRAIERLLDNITSRLCFTEWRPPQRRPPRERPSPQSLSLGLGAPVRLLICLCRRVLIFFVCVILFVLCCTSDVVFV